MAKAESKITRLITIVLAVLTGVLIYGCLHFDSVYEDTVNILENTNNSIAECNATIETQKQDIANLNAYIEEYGNVEAKINTIKQEYFENAQKVDALARTEGSNIKVAYLTFDDGPYLLTNKFLDVLEEYDVQATFFILKKTDPDYDPIYQRYKTNCHTIGNHTASHKISKGIYRSEEVFVEDILTNRKFIEDKLGVTTNVMRFPGGSFQATYMGLDKSSLVSKLVNIGYGYVDWNSATGDGSSIGLSPDQYLHNVIDNINGRKVLVILMHDYSSNTQACLGDLIEYLRDDGYTFLPLWYDSPAVIKQ